ncbi:Homoserine kinase [Emticicia aquatica]|uniref:Homoserine kinase n=1 Tax=Emticicia aquatica TaxID=1681835 RepID=A0ABN8EPZ8_9BACT|nr:phosphotransferase [Emticicia aquatica]CAH0994710.1 Homoserine kinase [Emticicia aquatica]
MSHFPVISSNLSTVHLASFLKEKYCFSGNTQCNLLKTGINHTYLVQSGVEKFIFRVYSLNWRTEVEILEEIRLLNTLKAQEISISHPIFDKNKNYIQSINAPEGERLGLMFSFAKGEKLLNFSEETHFKVGQLMAQIHQITLQFNLERVQYSPQILLIDSLNYIENFLPNDSEEMDFMKKTQQYLIDEFSKIDVNLVRKGAVHLDIWFDNLNITKDNKITIFDFDFCGNGLLCMDIAYYILQLNSTEKDEAVCQSKIKNFLNGYESITKITDEEKRIIPMLGVSLYFFYLGIQCQRFDNWSNTFLNETYLKRFINLLVKRYFELNKLG